jgi:hypothetical protein
LALAACAAISPRTQSLGVSTAAAGVAATDAALTTYSKLEPLREQEVINSNTANILTIPEQSVPAVLSQLAEPNDAERARQGRWKAGLKAREEAARELQAAYRAFNRLSSGKFGDDTTDAFGKAASAVTAFAKARDLQLSDSPIPGIVGNALGELVRYRQARDIKRHNAVLAELSRQFQTLWEADLPAFEQAIDGAYNMRLRQAMVSLPANAFDASAVANQVPEPLSTDLKLRLYRMRLLSSSSADAETAKAQLQAVRKALGALQDAHVELAKDSPSLSDVIEYLDHVIDLSKEAETGDGK